MAVNDFFAALAQLGWGLTVGALTAAIVLMAQLFGLIVCAISGVGLATWWWRRRRSAMRVANARDATEDAGGKVD